MKNQMKERKGITLIALVITIIVLLILAGVTIATLTGDNGLLQKAANSKQVNEKGEIEEQIKLAYNDWKLRKETGETVDLQNTVQTTLDKTYDNVTISKQGKSIIINVKGNEFTLIDDGTMEEGQVACLDIADGNIDLYSNGYKQYTGNLQGLNKNGATEYTGKYIITGTTTENVVRVCDVGEYNITIKDLNIDVAEKLLCAFNANEGYKREPTFVNLILEGENKLYSGYGAGLMFRAYRALVDGLPESLLESKLIIDGKGTLDAECKAGYDGSGIGGLYDANSPVTYIEINNVNITAIGKNTCGIGGGLRQQVENIIINGGNINTNGIGTNSGTLKSLTINGGNIISSGNFGNSVGNSKFKITGGNVIITPSIWRYTPEIKFKDIEILGGTINAKSAKSAGIACDEGGSINIIGGNLYARGNNNLSIATYEGSSIVPYTPKNGESNLYETPIKLQGIEENKQITKLTTSDNIEYGIKDMYTLENGMLYLYLPTGTRTITIEVDGKKYSGAVQTTETPAEVTLSETN